MRKVYVGLIFLCAISVVAGMLFRYAFTSERKIAKTIDKYTGNNENSNITVLFTGLDKVGNNTDSIILASLDTYKKSVCLLQIPRDTYIDRGASNGKINNLYATSLLGEMNDTQAMNRLKTVIGQALAVPVDYYISFDLDALERVVDGVGGVEIDVPCDMTYYDEDQNLEISLKKGVQVLDGEQAMLFIRYRSSYIEGDIGRIDAQKIFLSAMLRKLKTQLTPATATSVAKEIFGGCESDMPLELMLALTVGILSESAEYQVCYVTAPGEAIMDYNTSLWYYVLNREAMSELLGRYFAYGFNFDNFDTDRIFTKEDNIGFTNIYYAPKYDYEIYFDGDIEQIDIKTK